MIKYIAIKNKKETISFKKGNWHYKEKTKGFFMMQYNKFKIKTYFHNALS
jgi:hypothetical protein